MLKTLQSVRLGISVRHKTVCRVFMKFGAKILYENLSPPPKERRVHRDIRESHLTFRLLLKDVKTNFYSHGSILQDRFL